MYVGCTLDVRWMMLDVRCQYDKSQNVGKVVFCNNWACSQNPCYGKCVFLLRFCINKCDVLAVKLACQGGPPLGAPAESCFSKVVCCQIVIGRHSQPSRSLWHFAAPVSFRGNSPKPLVDLEQCAASKGFDEPTAHKLHKQRP